MHSSSVIWNLFFRICYSVEVIQNAFLTTNKTFISFLILTCTSVVKARGHDKLLIFCLEISDTEGDMRLRKLHKSVLHR